MTRGRLGLIRRRRFTAALTVLLPLLASARRVVWGAPYPFVRTPMPRLWPEVAISILRRCCRQSPSPSGEHAPEHALRICSHRLSVGSFSPPRAMILHELRFETKETATWQTTYFARAKSISRNSEWDAKACLVTTTRI